jgi:Fe-coproporphyrin III synthase
VPSGGAAVSQAPIPQPRWNEVAREYNLRRDSAVLRGPVEWSVDVTNECVGRCQHCFNRSGLLHRDELSSNELGNLMRQIAAMKPLGLCLCGGEPLLRAPIVLPLAKLLANTGTGVNMVTNGMLVNEKLAAQIKDAGIKMVQVSLDGVSAESHDRLRCVPGSWEKAVNAIRLLRAEGITVGVAFTPTSYNCHEFGAVHQLCSELGAFELRIQPLMPLGEAQIHYDEISPTPAQYQTLVDEYKAVLMSKGFKAAVEWGDPVDHLIRFGQFYSMPTFSLHVTSDGFLVPSVYLPVVLGNIRRHTLAEYWEAGVSCAWQLRLIRELSYRIRSNRDFLYQKPNTFFDAPVDLDLIDHNPAEVEDLTDTVLAFVEKLSPEPTRPAGPWSWRPRSSRTAARLDEAFGLPVVSTAATPNEEP